MSNSLRTDIANRAPLADAYSVSQVQPSWRGQACMMSSLCAGSAQSAHLTRTDRELQGVGPWHGNSFTPHGSQQGNSFLRFTIVEAPPMMYNAGDHTSHGLPPLSQKPNTSKPGPFGGGAFRPVLPGIARCGPLPPPKRRRAACPGCNRESIAIGSCSFLCSDCLHLIQPPDSNEPTPGESELMAAPGHAVTQQHAGSTTFASMLSSTGSLLCEEIGCGNVVGEGQEHPFCHLHKHLPWRWCEHEGCTRRTRTGAAALCKKHGGGRRCSHKGCFKVAAAGGPLCCTHGGGRRCQHRGCDRAARAGGAPFCASHGGGKRCEYPGCESAARAGFPSFCFAHGGGPRCAVENCNERAQTRTKHRLCAAHARQFARTGELRHFTQACEQLQFPRTGEQLQFPRTGEQLQFPRTGEQLQFPRTGEQLEFPQLCEEVQMPLQANHYQPPAYAYDPLMQNPMTMPVRQPFPMTFTLGCRLAAFCPDPGCLGRPQATSTAWQMQQASYVAYDAGSSGYSYVDPVYESNMGPAVHYPYYGSSWGM